MVGKIYCPMIILKKGEEVTDKNQFEAYVDTWMDDGDIYIEIMDEKDKSVIISMSPELYFALGQKAIHEAQEKIQKLGVIELSDGEIKLPITTQPIIKADSKLAIV
jgi:hypothetical protein